VTPEERIAALEARVARQDAELELLRAKLFALQEAMIERTARRFPRISSPGWRIMPIVRGKSAHAPAAIIGFGGMSRAATLPVPEYRRTLDELPVDAFYVRDFWQFWYQKGLLGLTGNIEETAALIRTRICARYRVHGTIGTSAGGWGAVIVGVLTGAARILTLAPQTMLNRKVYDEFGGLDTRVEELAAARRFGNMAEFLRDSGFRGRIDVHFGADNARDRGFAERLQGIDCVRLCPHPSDSHNISGWLRETGQLSRIVGDWASELLAMGAKGGGDDG